MSFRQVHRSRLKYITIIRGAVRNDVIQRWTTYVTQFRLCMAKGPNRSWATIDGCIRLFCGRLRVLSATTISSVPCYEYNFKGFCGRIICGYSHAFIKCKVQHTLCSCNLFIKTKAKLRSEIEHYFSVHVYHNFQFAAPWASLSVLTKGAVRLTVQTWQFSFPTKTKGSYGKRQLNFTTLKIY